MISEQTKILVVDDFDLVRTMLRRALGDLKITNIDDSRDGDEALRKIGEAIKGGKPYGAVFLDWNMPGTNGLQVLQACRTMPEMAKVPIIMVTAEGEKKQVIAALMAGATEYIVKPCSPEILSKKIQHINKTLQSKKAG
jgi:two-component system chemotaxis response regulator CheY